MRTTYLTRQTESVLSKRTEKTATIFSFKNHVHAYSPFTGSSLRFALLQCLCTFRKQWKAVGEISIFATVMTGTLRQPNDCTWKDTITHPSRTTACNRQQDLRELAPHLRVVEAASLPVIPATFLLSRTQDLTRRSLRLVEDAARLSVSRYRYYKGAVFSSFLSHKWLDTNKPSVERGRVWVPWPPTIFVVNGTRPQNETVVYV